VSPRLHSLHPLHPPPLLLLLCLNCCLRGWVEQALQCLLLHSPVALWRCCLQLVHH
jgi:hypothetical protein